MSKINRNKLCLCGSGLKYKKCYGVQNSKCIIFLREQRHKIIEDHNKREKFVFTFFTEVLEETNVILLKNERNHDSVPLRIQMIIIFSLLDMLSSYWFEYLGKTGKTGDRTKEWYKNFCMRKDNPLYLTPIDWSRISEEQLYSFRSSLVHFFGLSDPKLNGDISFGLVWNDYDIKDLSNTETQLTRKNRISFIIKPNIFYDLVREGAILMLEEWCNIIEMSQTDLEKEKIHIESIERIFKKIKKEGAVKIMPIKEI